MQQTLPLESHRHPAAHRGRIRLRVLCAAIFVALLAFAAFGGSAPAATGSHASRQAAPARGGKALTKAEFWRAQWRDEGAVSSADNQPVAP